MRPRVAIVESCEEDDLKLDASTRLKSLHNLCSDRGFCKRKNKFLVRALFK